MRLRLNAAALAAYVFGLVLIGLAGITLGGALLYALWFYILFPAVSLILLIRSFIAFHFIESFSTEHPVKHEAVLYTLTLANDTLLVPATVSIRFRSFGPGAAPGLAPLELVLRRRESRRETHTIAFPFRGIYDVGMERLEITDGLGWLSWRPPVWCRTFYVYPRVIELSSVFPGLRNLIESSGTGRGVIADHALFQDLREYRNERPIRHLAWKKFAATGNPYLREYEKTSWPGVEIYLDLRRTGAVDQALLEREDCSVEIMVALVHHFLSRGIRVRVHGANGHERYSFSGAEESDFTRFFKSTIAITFSGDRSPARLFRTDMEDRIITSGTVVFITHTADPEIFELADGSARQDLSFFAVVNRSGVAAEQIAVERARLGAADRGRIVFIESSDAIRERLEQ